ncbi:MAG TPA: hypothetical protein DCY20_10200 [Firmicutes bacterium]|nr:hypothetical protein [Bacillota bacterium]
MQGFWEYQLSGKNQDVCHALGCMKNWASSGDECYEFLLTWKHPCTLDRDNIVFGYPTVSNLSNMPFHFLNMAKKLARDFPKLQLIGNSGLLDNHCYEVYYSSMGSDEVELRFEIE